MHIISQRFCLEHFASITTRFLKKETDKFKTFWLGSNSLNEARGAFRLIDFPFIINHSRRTCVWVYDVIIASLLLTSCCLFFPFLLFLLWDLPLLSQLLFYSVFFCIRCQNDNWQNLFYFCYSKNVSLLKILIFFRSLSVKKANML